MESMRELVRSRQILSGVQDMATRKPPIGMLRMSSHVGTRRARVARVRIDKGTLTLAFVFLVIFSALVVLAPFQ